MEEGEGAGGDFGWRRVRIGVLWCGRGRGCVRMVGMRRSGAICLGRQRWLGRGGK